MPTDFPENNMGIISLISLQSPASYKLLPRRLKCNINLLLPFAPITSKIFHSRALSLPSFRPMLTQPYPKCSSPYSIFLFHVFLPDVLCVFLCRRVFRK